MRTYQHQPVQADPQWKRLDTYGDANRRNPYLHCDAIARLGRHHSRRLATSKPKLVKTH